MKRYVTIVLTENDAYYLENSDDSEYIIKAFEGLDDFEDCIVVQCTPPLELEENKNIRNVNDWIIDTKISSLESRVKRVLAKIIAEQNIGSHITKGDGEVAHAGYRGTAIVGVDGIATAGIYGKAVAGLE